MSKDLVNTITLWTAIVGGFALLVAFPGFFVAASVFAIIAAFLYFGFSQWTWENTASVFGPPLAFEVLRRLYRGH